MRRRHKDQTELFFVFIFTFFVGIINCKSVLDICDRKPIHTTAPRAHGAGKFWIKIHGLPSEDKYTPGETYTVEVNGTHNLIGLMLVAVPTADKIERKDIGEFHVSRLGRLEKSSNCDHTVLVHRYLISKNGVSVKWTAPVGVSECVDFRATVIENPNRWYKDADKLTVSICPKLVETQRDEIPVVVNDPSSCCRCQDVAYKMTFHGRWSRESHPKGFPTDSIDIDELLWSSIIGATHSKSYNLWKFGHYASDGVKNVCESGDTSTAEEDMKKNGGRIRTVVRTDPMRDTMGTLHTSLKANPTQHYLSFLSMFGPSPDWCVGVTSLDLCDKSNCSWIEHKEISLYPWDAGTTSGSSYFSRPIRTDPREKIHRLTNTYPNDPYSPFYGEDRVKPMAKLTLTKTSEECHVTQILSDDTKLDTPVGDDDLHALMKEQVETGKKKDSEMCATDDWSDWTLCSSDCGVGEKNRRRNFKNPDAMTSFCNVDLVEKVSCVGNCSKNKYSMKEYNVFGNKKKHCLVTPFSDWSTCSVTCGLGIRERWRMFLTKVPNNNDCGIHLMEKQVCVGRKRVCPVANVTDQCFLPMDKGPCTGSYDRFYYDTQLRRCLSFKYGGCNGNGNNFVTLQQCHMTCVTRYYLQRKTNQIGYRQWDSLPINDMYAADGSVSYGQSASLRLEQPSRDVAVKRRRKYLRMLRKKKNGKRRKSGVRCKMSPWSDWSSCSVTCGKGLHTRTRSIKVHPTKGRTCSKKMLRKKKCKLAKCPIDCRVGEWTSWTPCSRTCGENAVQVRKRKITQRPKRGGKRCPAKRNKRFCNLPLCQKDDVNVQDAFMSPGHY